MCPSASPSFKNETKPAMRSGKKTGFVCVNMVGSSGRRHAEQGKINQELRILAQCSCTYRVAALTSTSDSAQAFGVQLQSWTSSLVMPYLAPAPGSCLQSNYAQRREASHVRALPYMRAVSHRSPTQTPPELRLCNASWSPLWAQRFVCMLQLWGHRCFLPLWRGPDGSSRAPLHTPPVDRSCSISVPRSSRNRTLAQIRKPGSAEATPSKASGRLHGMPM